MRRVIRVAIVDPHDGIRNALRDLIEAEADLRVTAFGEVAVDRLAGFDVVLADERLAGASSGAARSTLEAISKRVPVVVMGMGEPEYYAESMLAAGAVGYWPKFGDIDALVPTIRAAGLIAKVQRASDAPGAGAAFARTRTPDCDCHSGGRSRTTHGDASAADESHLARQ